jgi:hypothetical protein
VVAAIAFVLSLAKRACYDPHMEKDGERICDACGQRIPKMSKLATRENGRDLCLACQIREAQEHKGLRH